jgi:phage shock protein PspC (stress-responsive transcriptional regulator)
VNPRRLYRCRHDRQLAGVAAGMAEYLEIDPTVIRILWILSVFLGGFTILLYILLAFVMPLEPATAGPAGPAGGPAGFGAGQAGEPAGAPATWAETGTDTAPWTVASAPADGAIPGWVAPEAAHAHRTGGGDGRGGLFLGVLLVAFGVIALGNVALPGWFAAALVGPAILVALGVALLAVAGTRRSTADR